MKFLCQLLDIGQFINISHYLLIINIASILNEDDEHTIHFIVNKKKQCHFQMGMTVCPSVHPSVCLSVRPSALSRLNRFRGSAWPSAAKSKEESSVLGNLLPRPKLDEAFILLRPPGGV